MHTSFLTNKTKQTPFGPSPIVIKIQTAVIGVCAIPGLLLDTNTECLMCSSIHSTDNLLSGKRFFLPCRVRSTVSKCGLEITDESSMNAMGAHSAFLLHVGRRGVHNSRTKSPHQPQVGLLHSQEACPGTLGLKKQQTTKLPSASEKYEKNLLFLSTLSKPQCILFSELYKHYPMHTGYVKHSFTVWWKENLVVRDQRRELMLAHQVQRQGTRITYFRSGSAWTVFLPLTLDIHSSFPSLTSKCWVWESPDCCHHTHSQRKVELRNT